jgi:hypothetical protein
MDLTSKEFPSLWLEIETVGGKNVLMGGFYREWAPKQDRSVEAQTTAMKIFTRQIEAASAEQKSIIILGDANLCCENWDAPQFQHKTVANELRETLVQCGLQVSKLGFTYTADHLSTDGEEIKSALDHIYYSGDLEQKLKMTTIPSSATDHSPIIAKFITNRKKQKTTNCQKTVTKRSMKNFTQTRWIDTLRSRDWSKISSLKDVNEMTEEFTKELTKALDECAPLKKFKIRDHYKPGITQKTKLIMQERDSTRKRISSASKEEKPKLQAKYRQLRNRAVNQIRKDTILRNGDRIAKANNEGEMWRIVNEIVKPKSDNPFVINSPAGPITEEDEVANTFNKFFVDKIESLKEKIDPNMTSDPLTRIRKKFANSNLKFKLKPVTVSQVVKSMKGMSKKKSKGKDGIPQDCLLMGLEVLAAPLTEVVNRSIITGIVPEAWKEGIVVPVLKKGDAKELKNYRPVSCLTAASKVLEKVVCEQLTRFVEVNKILPNNQHGFRANRSTMTALTAMQKEWMKNSEDGLLTGVLVWDLSSAFDTLDVKLFLEKIKIYGSESVTVDWFR